MAADTSGDVPAQVTWTLSVLQADFFFPLAVGFAVFLLASGLALLRGAAFPDWPGWVALVLGLICLTPGGFFGVLGGLAWILGISVMLSCAALRRCRARRRRTRWDRPIDQPDVRPALICSRSFSRF